MPRPHYAFFLLAALLIHGVSSSFAQEDRPKAEAALAILDAWHAQDPKPGERKLHIVCWRPQDRDFAERYRERIPRIMDHIQQFYRDQMERNGLGPRTFNLDKDESGKLVIHESIGKDNYADYGRPDGGRIRRECLPALQAAGINADLETVLIFTNLSDWDAKKNTFFHKSPYYASGTHRSGTAWQLDSPELDIKNLSLKSPMIQDGEYGRISLGKHNSIFIGGIAHEMGHGFSLPHCRARDDEAKALGTALMGSGNRTYSDEVRGEGKGSFITLAHALRLASHPQFSGSVKGMNLPVEAKFHDLAVSSQTTTFEVTGQIESSLPPYAIIGYLDPEGGGDYDSRTVVAIPNEEGRFTLPCHALVSGKDAELRLVACFVNGATHTWRNSYRVAKDGTVDDSAMRLSLELTQFTSALQSREMKQAQSIRDQLDEGGSARRIADSILQSMGQRRAIPANQVPADLKSYPLSQIQPEEETVGWGKPAYDHLPRPNPLIISGPEIFQSAIYAHADARHRYDLSHANWTKLTGKCGLPSQRGGSVVFSILLDDKEVFRSPTTKPGKTHTYEIDLQGAKRLELITEDAGDGKNSDWGLWLAPTLHR